jgi:Bifunctional DNA primase/polymerase, N-terminal/AAA domain/Primase C terminal 1 (PriCT-1)
MAFLEIALRNAARGFRVHPLHSKEKLPILKGWPDQATRDTGTIEQWAAQFPDANCGVAVGPDLCVLESDDLAKLKELLGGVEIPDTYTVQARDNRPHFYFRQTEKTNQSGNRTLAGVFEFKQSHLQVVAEGSTHPCGAIYRVIDDSPIVPMPDELMTAIVRLYLDGKARETREAAPVEGGRNNYLTSVGGKLRNAGLSEEALAVALLQHNADVCQPPLEDEEVRRIAASVARYPVPEPVGEVIIGSSKPEEKKITDWRELFHSREAMLNAPPITFLIKDYLMREGVTAIAAPVRERKSLIALNVCHSLLTGEKLFDHFEVVHKPSRVLYLCPEVSLGPFTDRIRKIGLMGYVGETLFCRTLSADGHLTLNAPELQPALPGSVVILDTAIRFLEGDENSSSDVRKFADSIFALMRGGAESVVMLHHSPKGNGDTMTLENAMRGSGDMGAFLACCWGTRLQDPSKPYQSASYLENLKQRDFESKPFEVTSGEDCRLHIVGDPRTREVTLQPRKGNKGNKDGKDDAAEAVIRANPKLKIKELEEQLKALGIQRGTTWIGKARARINGTGVTTGEAA